MIPPPTWAHQPQAIFPSPKELGRGLFDFEKLGWSTAQISNLDLDRPGQIFDPLTERRDRIGWNVSKSMNLHAWLNPSLLCRASLKNFTHDDTFGRDLPNVRKSPHRCRMIDS